MRAILSGLLLLMLSAPVMAQTPTSGMAAGKYGLQPAWENPTQNMGDGQTQPGYAKMDYAPGKILKIRLREGMVTVINLPAWESIKDSYVGDQNFFIGSPISKNTLMLSVNGDKAGADTNMIVFGASGNKYAFYIQSEPINTETITHSIVDINVPNSYRNGGSLPGGNALAAHSMMGGATFNKGSSSKSAMDAEDYGWIKSIPVDPTEFRFDLDIFVPNPDDYIIAPDRVWRDQVFTYIDFGDKALAMTQRPVVSILVEGGEAPVGFRTDGPNGRLMIVEAVGDMVLRNGQRLVCIKKRDETKLMGAQYPSGAEIGGMSVMQDMPMGEDFGSLYGGGMPAPVMNGAPMTAAAMASPVVAGMNMNPISPANGVIVKEPTVSLGSLLPNDNPSLVRQDKKEVVLELASAGSIHKLQAVWSDLTSNENFNQIVGEFEPFYAIDTAGVDALGTKQYHGAEVYRLRIGPVKDLETGSVLCRKLTTKNIPCSVVRTQ